IRIKEYLGRELPDYMIPSHWVPLEAIPLTPNGKVDKRALPAPAVLKDGRYAAPGDQVEQQLLDIWLEVLNITPDSTQSTIGIDDNFFHLGGQSLKATLLATKIHKTFNVNVPMTQPFNTPTIRGLAQFVRQTKYQRYQSIEPVEKRDYYILSPPQKRLYILQQMESDYTGYNMPRFIPLGPGETIDRRKLESAFKKLIHRHESLRTSFHLVKDEPVQRVHDEVDFGIEFFGRGAPPWSPLNGNNSGSHRGLPLHARDFVRPFDLSRAPLLRVGLRTSKEGDALLMIDMHNIISDGASVKRLETEWPLLYSGDPLPPLRLQYKDYSLWLNTKEQQTALRQQQDYWHQQFPEGHDIPVLNLPLDEPRPAVQRFTGATVRFMLNQEESETLKIPVKEANATLYMTILAIVNVLLSKLGRQEDIIVGCPVAGRRHDDLQPIMGMFVNTLAIRNSPSGDKTFNQLLPKVKINTTAALDNQEYPFEDLVEQLSIRRDTGRNPLFDVMFDLQDPMDDTRDPSKTADPVPTQYKHREDVAKFDLSVSAAEVGERLRISFNYCTQLFKPETVDRMIGYFRKLILLLPLDPDRQLSGVELITEPEKRQILDRFNRGETAYPRDKTVHRLFEEQVEKTPHRVAIVNREEQISYTQLNQRAGRLTRILIKKGLAPGTIAAIIMAPSIETVTGIIAILKTGAAYLPVDPDYPQERIRFILADSAAILCISEDSMKEKDNDQLSMINYQLLMKSTALSASSAVKSEPANPAYIIYTSGTTGSPKGVMVEHRSVVAYLHAFYDEIDLTYNDVFLQQASFSFDVFAEEVFAILLRGGKSAIVSKDVIMDMERYPDFLLKQDVTVTSCSPLLLNQISQFPTIGSIRIFIVGGDVLRREHIGNLPGRARVYNCYGPTETTIAASLYLCVPGGPANPPIGKPMSNYSLYILDKYYHLQPVGVPGELCIAGVGVSRGYLNRPELTKEKFALRTSHFALNSTLYHTGDLTRWLPDGNVEFLGRIDHQVKIRGFRIELGEIENRLAAYDTIKEAVVVDMEDMKGDKYLCAYLVADAEKSNEWRDRLAKELPEYMIPAYFIQLETLPLTPNGKLDKPALPGPIYQTGTHYAAPRNPMERQLRELWLDVLGRDHRPGEDSVGIHDDFFRLGGHSLRATVLISKIHKVFHVKLPLAEFFAAPTIQGMARYIKKTAPQRHVSVEPAEKRDYYPLSPAQKRMYILQQMETGHTGYNMPQFYPLPPGESIDTGKMGTVFKQLILRHESFRTSFHLVNDEPVQRVHDAVEFEIGRGVPPWSPLNGNNSGIHREGSHGEGSHGEGSHGEGSHGEGSHGEGSHGGQPLRDFVRPFDLSQAPLLRVALGTSGKGAPLLMIDMHHIISDGVSHQIVERQWWALFSGEELLHPRLQYKDYALWLNLEEQRRAIKEQETYWLGCFSANLEVPVIQLPLDFHRPLIQGFDGASVGFVLSQEEAARLTAPVKTVNVTLYMTVLAVLNVLLSKLGGQEDIIVGSPVAGRPHADLQSIIGMFVNTLALRNFPSAGKTFKQLLQEVKTTAAEAFENQDYPFEELVDNLSLPRDTGRNPLFDVMFNLLNQDDGMDSTDPATPPQKSPLPGEMTYTHRKDIAKFDLTLTATQAGDRVHFSFNYRTQLFKPQTIERIIVYFRKLASQLPLNPDQPLSEIQLITEPEKRQILHDFNDTRTRYPQEKTIHRLFEEQVDQTPDSIALAAEGTERRLTQLTYRDLNQRVDGLADSLKKRGVEPGTIVAIMADRSIDVITGILGILKAGAAYLPIDPNYPRERIDFMLRDSGAKVVIGTGLTVSGSDGPGEQTHPPINHETIKPTHLAYIIYTSGSTGNPKGVMVEHRNVVRLVRNTNYMVFNPRHRIMQTGALTFDASTFEIWGALLNGLQLHLPGEETLLTPGELKAALRRYDIGTIWMTASLFNQMVDSDIDLFDSLKHLLAGGDVLSPIHINRLRNHSPHLTIINGYGPTENTTFSTTFPIDREYARDIPIGRPIANSTAYIVDHSGHLVPVGVPGELVAGGDGVSRGYLNNPELTAEKFVTNDKLSVNNVYMTGDLARWLSDGSIQFLGRRDRQVKIRGYRVELGEIEYRVSNDKTVKDVVVVDREDIDGDKYLCAYYVPVQGGYVPVQGDYIPVEKETHNELRDRLAKELPDYMIPSYFVPLETLPLTAAGKINRNALPQPEIAVDDDYVSPQSELEQQLAGIWSGVLGIPADKISAVANFFHLGGHSLKATIMAAKIREQFHVNIPLVEIFNQSTIRQLALRIGSPQSGGPAPEPLDDRLVLLKRGTPDGGHQFFIHDGSGDVEGYIEFCNHLDPAKGYHCWGVRAPRYDGYAPRNLTIEAVASGYIDAVKKLQPSGPYRIAGWSLGGTIAFEMVRQLEQAGETLQWFGIIDSPPPPKQASPAPEAGIFTPRSEHGWFDRYLPQDICRELANMDDIELMWTSVIRYLETNPDQGEMIRQMVIRSHGVVIPNAQSLEIGQLVRYLNTIRGFDAARSLYVPSGKLETTPFYFGASQSESAIRHQRWNNFCKESLVFSRIDGDHHSIFKSPRVGELSSAFDRQVSQASRK
ncbi:MAG: amino acid adenylation domain-containing protein, partial [bacterium]|nr:amino acid adenylation domain-containing protein [bacterium]